MKILRFFFILPNNKHKKTFKIQTQKETHPPNMEKTNFHVKKKEKHYSTFVQLSNENQYWHEDLLLFDDDKKTLIINTSWLGSQHMYATMKILHETKLQHQGYESHQYSLYYGSTKFEKKCLQYLHINMKHWILTSLDPTNTHTPCILYDSKTHYDKVLCENTTLKISKLLNIDHLN